MVLTFNSVTGAVACGPVSVGCPTTGADGGNFGFAGTDISSPGSGLSAVQFTGRQMFLMGVFLTAATPSGAGPAAIVHSAASVLETDFFPLIGQTFFVGDGLGTTGQQNFYVPAGATRLFLGFADGVPGFVGSPGAYGDNSGSLTVDFAEIGRASCRERV